MSAFTERLRLAADRVSRHCFKQPGDSGLMSIPADPERDVDLLLVEAAAEIERLRGLLREALNRNDWMLHNGGLWCVEWPKEWSPSKHGPLIPWLSGRIDAALREVKP